MSNEVKYEKGDILWDSKNNVLYVYSSDENLIKEGIHVACPIPLNDLIFTKVLFINLIKMKFILL